MIVIYDVNPGVAYGTMPNSTGLGDAASTNGYVGMSAKWAAAYDAAYAKNIAAGMTPNNQAMLPTRPKTRQAASGLLTPP